MKYMIKHDTEGRIRVKLFQKTISCEQSDKLKFYLENIAGVRSVDIYSRTAGVAVSYSCSRQTVIDALNHFEYQNVKLTGYRAAFAQARGQKKPFYMDRDIQKLAMQIGIGILSA